MDGYGHGYYCTDRERWITAAEQGEEYAEMMESIQADEDARRAQQVEDQEQGINWLSVAAEITRPVTPAATVRPLAPLAPLAPHLLTPHDCLDIADVFSALRMDPDHTPRGSISRDDYRRWERQLRGYAVTLADVHVARRSA